MLIQNDSRMLLLVAAIALGVSGAATAQNAPAAREAPMAAQSSTAASKALHAEMMSGMGAMHQMKPSGDVDKDFAHMMQHHHQQAVRMTQAYLKGAQYPRLKAWAQKSMEGQQHELEELKRISPRQ